MRLFLSFLLGFLTYSNAFSMECKYSVLTSAVENKEQSFRSPSLDLWKLTNTRPLALEMEKAAQSLGLSVQDFRARLKENNISPRDFFRMVDRFKNGEDIPLWRTLLSPKLMAQEIKGRRIVNKDFISNFMNMAGIHSGAQIAAHLSILGLEALPILSAQLTALIITEIALTYSSAKHAAYLVAFPNLIEEGRSAVKQLSKEELLFLARVKNSFAKMFRATRTILSNSADKFSGLLKVAFFSSLIPFSILNAAGSSSLSDMLALSLISSGFHAAFISIWSNFRYELVYGKLFPAISNSQILQRSRLIKNVLVYGLIAANMAVASYTYTAGSEMSYSLFGYEFVKSN